MSTFTIKLPIIFDLTGDWVDAAPNYSIGFPAAPPTSGHLVTTYNFSSVIATTANGTFTLGNLIPGFKPTTNLQGKFNIGGTNGIGDSLTYGFFGSSQVGITNNTFLMPDNTSLLTLIGGFQTLDASIVSALGNYGLNIDVNIVVSGDYIIESFSWSASVVGDNLQVTSDGVTPNLTEITSIKFNYDNGGITEEVEITSDKFTTQETDLIEVPLPKFCAFVGLVLITANSATFVDAIVDNITI